MSTNNAVNSPLSGTTGTGKFVGSISPSITTGINDSNGNASISIFPTASAVNYVQIYNAATGNAPNIGVNGSDSNIPLILSTIGTGGVIVKGTGTNDNASAGNVGEYKSNQVLLGSAVNLTNNTASDITSMSLTAGDWDVWGNAFITGATNPTSFSAWVSTSSATAPDASLRSGQLFTAGTITQIGLPCSPIRVSISTTTTVYLSAISANTAGTPTGCGIVYARRRR